MRIWKKRLYMILLAAVMAFLCVGCASERKEEQLALRQQGIEYMEKGDYENALDAFQKALDTSLGEIGEEEIDICFYKAEALYLLGDTQGAMDTYSAVIDYNQNPKAYFLRGNLYYSIGEGGKAVEDYKAALNRDGENYELYIGIYEVLVSYNRADEGRAYLSDALKINGTKAYDKMQKGYINFLLGENETGTSLLKEAIEEKEMDAYYYLSEIYMAEQNYGEAVSCLESYLQQEEVENKQMAMKNLVAVYEYTNNFEKAKMLMEEYIKAYPEDEEAEREYTFLKTR